jgi:adenylylsulfate kinase-like enzyme
LVERDEFIEVYLDTPIEVCENRDAKGLYAKARIGQIKDFTGIDSPYEAPIDPELVLNTDQFSIQECLDLLFEHLKKTAILADQRQESFTSWRPGAAERRGSLGDTRIV